MIFSMCAFFLIVDSKCGRTWMKLQCQSPCCFHSGLDLKVMSPHLAHRSHIVSKFYPPKIECLYLEQSSPHSLLFAWKAELRLLFFQLAAVCLCRRQVEVSCESKSCFLMPTNQAHSEHILLVWLVHSRRFPFIVRQ